MALYHIGVYRGIKTYGHLTLLLNLLYHIGVYRGIKTLGMVGYLLEKLYHIGVYRGIKTDKFTNFLQILLFLLILGYTSISNVV